MQVNGTAPVYNTQQSYGSQPVTYTPGTQATYGTDQYRPAQQTTSSGSGLFGGSNQKQYVTRESVMMGVAGAGIGFLCGGPMGALIGGIIGLLVSVISNIVKSVSNKPSTPKGNIPATYNPQQQQQQVNYNNNTNTNTASQDYYLRLQQQQQQQQQIAQR